MFAACEGVAAAKKQPWQPPSQALAKLIVWFTFPVSRVFLHPPTHAHTNCLAHDVTCMAITCVTTNCLLQVQDKFCVQHCETWFSLGGFEGS